MKLKLLVILALLACINAQPEVEDIAFEDSAQYKWLVSEDSANFGTLLGEITPIARASMEHRLLRNTAITISAPVGCKAFPVFARGHEVTIATASHCLAGGPPWWADVVVFAAVLSLHSYCAAQRRHRGLRLLVLLVLACISMLWVYASRHPLLSYWLSSGWAKTPDFGGCDCLAVTRDHRMVPNDVFNLSAGDPPIVGSHDWAIARCTCADDVSNIPTVELLPLTEQNCTGKLHVLFEPSKDWIKGRRAQLRGTNSLANTTNPEQRRKVLSLLDFIEENCTSTGCVWTGEIRACEGHFIFTDTPLAPGMSGSACFSSEFEGIGVVVGHHSKSRLNKCARLNGGFHEAYFQLRADEAASATIPQASPVMESSTKEVVPLFASDVAEAVAAEAVAQKVSTQEGGAKEKGGVDNKQAKHGIQTFDREL
jgi:hypothetical protein